MPERPSLRAFVRRLDRRLGEIQRWAGPAASIGAIDLGVLRAWARNVGPVAASLGDDDARAYTDLVLTAAQGSAEIGRILAHTLPDHLARVEPSLRARYASLLRATLAQDPAALPLVARTLPDLLDRLEDENVAPYLARGVDLHRKSRKKAESFLRMESHLGRAEVAKLSRGVTLEQVGRALSLYAVAHCGDDVDVRPGGADAFTDGRHIYLPERVDRFGDERDALIYRVLTARNAGYIEYGTLDIDLDSVDGTWPERRPDELEIERAFRSFQNPSLARDLFGVFENLRIETRVRRDYPGVARDMDLLDHAWRPEAPETEDRSPVEQAVLALGALAAGRTPHAAADRRARSVADGASSAFAEVRAAASTVRTSFEAVRTSYPSFERLLVATSPRAEGGSREAAGADRAPPADLLRPTGSLAPRADGDRPRDAPSRSPFQGDLRTDRMSPGDREIERRAFEMSADTHGEERAQALGEARRRARALDGARDGSSYEEMADFLDRNPGPAGPARDAERTGEWGGTRGPPSAEPDPDVEAKAGTWRYPEWDAGIDDHKPDWVRLTEYRLVPGSGAFADDIRRRHGPLIQRVRRAFEALRPDAFRRVRGVVDGDEIDLDRAVEAHIERRTGGIPTDRVYMRHDRTERDVAVAFLVDMSSSTNEVANSRGQRVVDVEREALVLIAEAVDAIGDACAIYGFSGYGREQVAFYVAKDFADAYDDRIRERIGRISWKMENRDGAAIRHCARKLGEWPARVRLLILLSDGKPLDCGCEQYADTYAQEDTRMALREARTAGVHPFCITVDPRGPEYLKRMYGDVGYLVIDRVEALPEQMPRIYRRLTR